MKEKKKSEEKSHKWIAYITGPLVLIVFIICFTWMYSLNHPMTIRFEMDDNTLQAINISRMQFDCDNTMTYYVKENATLRQIDCENGKTILLGNDRDEHDCIISAGYSWCDSEQKCYRPWEETCEGNNLSDYYTGKYLTTNPDIFTYNMSPTLHVSAGDSFVDCTYDGCNYHCCNEVGTCTTTLVQCITIDEENHAPIITEITGEVIQ